MRLIFADENVSGKHLSIDELQSFERVLSEKKYFFIIFVPTLADLSKSRLYSQINLNVWYNIINLYYIPERLIVKHVTLRNMTINLSFSSIDNHIPQGDISDYYILLEIPIQSSH